MKIRRVQGLCVRDLALGVALYLLFIAIDASQERFPGLMLHRSGPCECDAAYEFEPFHGFCCQMVGHICDPQKTIDALTLHL
jgi:hypothetical protein